MLDGKTFLPVTGTPIRKMACISRLFADADPVPLAVAILKAKSLTRSMSLTTKITKGQPQRTRRTQRERLCDLGDLCGWNFVFFVAFPVIPPPWRALRHPRAESA